MWISTGILLRYSLQKVLLSSFFQDFPQFIIICWSEGSSLTSTPVDFLDFSTKPMVFSATFFSIIVVLLLRIQLHFYIGFWCYGVSSLVFETLFDVLRFWLKVPFNHDFCHHRFMIGLCCCRDGCHLILLEVFFLCVRFWVDVVDIWDCWWLPCC